MAKLKPWYQVVTPREDLREGKPLDASEFAVHLDHIREGRARRDYQEPERFFERTYLTRNLLDLAAQTVRRLSGIDVETSRRVQHGDPVRRRQDARPDPAVPPGPGRAGVPRLAGRPVDPRPGPGQAVPKAATAVFVGTEFDSITGRGGNGGEPLRKTPWGEIAWQLGGEKAFAVVAQHDEEGIAPGGDVIRAFLPDGPTLILMDELLNYVSRDRTTQEQAGRPVLQLPPEPLRRGPRPNERRAVRLDPGLRAGDDAEDQRDYESIQEDARPAGQGGHHVGRDGDRRDHPPPALRVVRAARRRQEDRRRLCRMGASTTSRWSATSTPTRPGNGSWRPTRSTRRLLSVFERKWQSLPRFQKTRGVLRLLALWVSHAYKQGFEGAHRDPLIGLGTAPLEDPYFRAALFEQLGQQRPRRPGHHRHRRQEGRPRPAARPGGRGRGQEGPAAPEGRDGRSCSSPTAADPGRGDRARDPPGRRRARPRHRQRRDGPRSPRRKLLLPDGGSQPLPLQPESRT